jgi:hypothetical protein
MEVIVRSDRDVGVVADESSAKSVLGVNGVRRDRLRQTCGQIIYDVVQTRATVVPSSGLDRMKVGVIGVAGCGLAVWNPSSASCCRKSER